MATDTITVVLQLLMRMECSIFNALSVQPWSVCCHYASFRRIMGAYKRSESGVGRGHAGVYALCVYRNTQIRKIEC